MEQLLLVELYPSLFQEQDQLDLLVRPLVEAFKDLRNHLEELSDRKQLFQEQNQIIKVKELLQHLIDLFKTFLIQNEMQQQVRDKVWCQEDLDNHFQKRKNLINSLVE